MPNAADKRQSEDQASGWLQDGDSRNEVKFQMEDIAKRYTAVLQFTFGLGDRQAGARKGLFGAVEAGTAIGPDSGADAAFPCPLNTQSGNTECKLPCYFM